MAMKKYIVEKYWGAEEMLKQLKKENSCKTAHAHFQPVFRGTEKIENSNSSECYWMRTQQGHCSTRGVCVCVCVHNTAKMCEVVISWGLFFSPFCAGEYFADTLQNVLLL